MKKIILFFAIFALLTTFTNAQCIITGSNAVCSGSATQLCAPSNLSAYLWSTGATR